MSNRFYQKLTLRQCYVIRISISMINYITVILFFVLQHIRKRSKKKKFFLKEIHLLYSRRNTSANICKMRAEWNVFVSILLLAVFAFALLWYCKKYIAVFLKFPNIIALPFLLKYILMEKKNIPATSCKYFLNNF